MKIIAEIGVNYIPDQPYFGENRYIHAAKKAGADFVKFQMFNKEIIKDSPLKKTLEKYILTEEQVAELKKTADKEKIGFILTPMYIEAVDIAEKYADMIKIRFKDNENEPLLNRVNETNKDVLISVPRPPINFFEMKKHFLYCLPKYPPEPEEFNLDLACVCQGFSSHFPHTLFDLAYAINRTYDSAFIEKHVKMDIPGLINDAVIDSAVSITFEELQSLISQLKLLERMRRVRL